MSTTATVSVRLSATAGQLTAALAPSSLSLSPAADAMAESLQTIGTSAELIGTVDIGTGGWFACQNTDATNFVVLSLNNDGSSPFAKLLAGEFACFPVGTKTIYAKADTAPVNLAYVMLSR